MKQLDLCGKWEGSVLFEDGSAHSFEGQVPGCAISDLIAAKKLPSDLFFEKNAEAVKKLERCDYRYTKSFSFAGDTSRAKLYFERLDTYADVYLNKKHLSHSENGNISHEIPVGDALLQGENRLEVRLCSPVRAVEGKPARSAAFTAERLHTRRMQCTYGWDWVARFVTCGIGACRLLVPEADELLFDNVYIATPDADAESATVRVDIGLDTPYRAQVLTLEIKAPDGRVVARTARFCAEGLLRFDLDVPAPQLWYPLGYGAQPLYTLEISEEGRLLHSERFGIRTVKILQLPDPVGSENHQKCLSIQNPDYDLNVVFSGFALKVNGKRIFCQGANWVPCVPYAMGDISTRQTRLLELCAAAGVNMLRVWGGGAFESKHFYSECARLGITVTQDFLMACGAYPEDEDWFIGELKKEALYAARLLRNNPALVWWTGDNENAVKGCDTDEDYRGRRSAYEGIAPILYREDPYRRFLPSSPFGGNKYASNTVGTTHNTQFLKRLFAYIEGGELSTYKEEMKKYRARFIAEEAQLGAASPVSLRRFMREADILAGEEMWLYHTQSNPALKHELFEYLTMFTRGVLGEFTDGQDRLFKLRYIQYEWVRVQMEQARRERGFCDGIIFWMMNDCWPAAAGWSLIDYYGIPKDAYYAFLRCGKPVITSIEREGDSYRVLAAGNGARTYAIEGSVWLLDTASGAQQRLSDFSCSVEPLRAAEVFRYDTPLRRGEVLICDIKGDFGSDRSFYKEGALTLHRTEASVCIDKKAHSISVRAEDYIHALTLTGEVLFSENCFSLLPGEQKAVTYQPLNGADVQITAEAYTI